jgi:hypothetical protein
MAVRTDDLEDLDDRELGQRAESAIMAAAIVPTSNTYHDAVDAIYDECARRDKGIYQRAWNRAVKSQGHHGMVRTEHPTSGA